MRQLVVLVVLCLMAHGAWCDMIALGEPALEELQIHNDHVVNVYLGNPGKWLRLRVRDDTDAIYVFQHPSPYSYSWRALPQTDAYGQPRIRDTLVLGSSQLRADLIVGRFPDETATTVEGTQAEGVLGIGARSPLWTIWRNFTKSRDLLVLGEALHRPVGTNSAATIESLAAQLPPPWAYGLGLASTFVSEFRATLVDSSRRELERECHRSLGSVVDEAADAAGIDQTLVRVLGVAPDEQLCAVQTEYRLLLVPNSDYNVIPRALMMHAVNAPPVFHLRSTVADNASDTVLAAVLFNRFDDTYIELDTTNSAGSGVRRQANRVRPGQNNTIVLGEYGLRRFMMSYELDASRAYLALKHNGLARTSHTQVADHSIEVRRIQDIFVLVAGLLLWALLATEPDPVYPKHAHQDNDHFAHSRHTSLVSPQDTSVIPGGALASKQPAAVAAAPVYQLGDSDGSYKVPIRSVASALSSSSVDVPQTIAEAPADTAPAASADDRRNEEIQELATDTSIRLAAVLRATFRMESEWPVTGQTLLYVQALSEAVVAIYFALAMGFYDTTWALSMVLVRTPTSDALGWTTLAFMITVVVLLSVVAAVAAGCDARVGSLALQTQVLVAIYVLLVALFQWDLALGLLFVVAALVTIVLIIATLTTWGLVPQYHKHASPARQQMRLPVVIVTLGWLVYSSIALFPFIVNRLWDENDNQAVVISVFLVAGVALPIGVYLSFAPFVYPLMTANAVCKRIFDAAQRRYSAITGSP